MLLLRLLCFTSFTGGSSGASPFRVFEVLPQPLGCMVSLDGLIHNVQLLTRLTGNWLELMDCPAAEVLSALFLLFLYSLCLGRFPLASGIRRCHTRHGAAWGKS